MARKTERPGPTIVDVEQFNAFLQRQSGTYFLTDNPEQTKANRLAAEELIRRVARYPRYSYGLARNRRIVAEVLAGVDAQRTSPEIAGYNAAERALKAEPRPADISPDAHAAAMLGRVMALQAEHDLPRLQAEQAARVAALQKSPALKDDGKTPVEFYRIALDDLPGWNDSPGTLEGQRGGVLAPLEMEMLDALGVIYDPADEITPVTPLKK